MSSYKELSQYYSDDTNKKASVVKELGTKSYIVRLTNDSGSSFSTTFDNEEDAEQFAEDWVTE